MTLADADQSQAPRRAPMREIHVRDLVAVIRQRWKIVGFLTALVTAVIYLSGRDVVPRYQSRLTVQVSSSKQVFARTDDIDLNEVALRTDPIRSEALILTTQALALKVVRTLNLQLELTDPAVWRGDVFSQVAVDSGAPPARYRLDILGSDGYEIHDESDGLVTAGDFGQPATGPGFRVSVVPASQPRSVEFAIGRPERSAARVSAGINYRIREGTNAIDITFAGLDQTLVPHILNQAALELRREGADRARQAATRRRSYIDEQVVRAREASDDKLRELQRYKETERIVNLTSEEQSIVHSIREFEQQRQNVLIQISTLQDALGERDSIGISTLNRLSTVQGVASNAALSFQIQRLLELYEERRSLTAGALGLRPDNPQVQAIDQRMAQAHAALRVAVDAALASMGDRETAIQREVAGLRARLQTFPGKETQIAQLQLESNILRETHRYLLAQLQQAQLQEATISPYVSILDGASPAFPIGTNLGQKVILGMLVGLILGLAGAFFLDYLDQTIKSAIDIERTVGMPVLGLIPHEPRLAVGANGRKSRPFVVVTALGPDDPAVEAYRTLRTNVTFVGAEKPLQVVAVTSPSPGEGKSTTAANLAVTLARGGSRTLLIDSDLRRPLQHRAFSLAQEPGLTDVLVGNVSTREAIRPNVAEHLDVLPSGSIPPNPSELLGSDSMQRLLAEVRREYDFILMDTPPTLPVTDAAVVATAADATIVVVRSGETEEVPTRRAIDQLRRVRARVAGVVLNGVSPKHDQHYSYYSYRQEPPTRQSITSLILSKF